MDTNTKRSTTENVPLVVISPKGTTYIQGSLRQCASFISELYTRVTGGAQRYFDYKLIRNRIDFDGGEFSGPLAGWKIVEFPDFTSLRSYLWDRDGITSTPMETDPTEPPKDGGTEVSNDGRTEDLNTGIQCGPEVSPNVTSDWSQIEVGTPPSTSVAPRRAGNSLEEFERIFSDI